MTPRISALTEDERHLDPRFSTLIFGPKHGLWAQCMNMIIDAVFLSDVPKHWTLRDALNEPDWEDWRDFTILCAALRREPE